MHRQNFSYAQTKKAFIKLFLSLCAIPVFIIAIDISAQAQTDSAQEAKPNSPPTANSIAPSQTRPQPSDGFKIGKVTFSGSLRLRVENWHWYETSAADNRYTFGAALLKLSLSQKTERIDWQVEGAFPAFVNLPERSIAGPPQGQLGVGASYFAASGTQDASAILKQAFVRLKSVGGDVANSLRIGRFEFADGTEVTPTDPTLAILKRDHIAHRLVGPFSFTHVQRTFDGAQYVRNTKSYNLTILGARPTEGVFQLNGNKELDIDFYYGALTKGINSSNATSEVRAFALHYHDGRGALKTDNRSEIERRTDGENIRLTTVGGHYISAIKSGKGSMDLLIWGVGQFGSWGNLNHRAGSIAIEGGYQFAAKAHPWLRAGYFRSTGDGNPTDSNHTTFFQMLPTPRIYARFPFYNLMNNEDIFAQLRLKPQARLGLRADVHHLRLSNENDLWYLGGGAFQKSTFGFTGRPSGGRKSLGTLADLSVDYSLAQKTALTFYIGGVRGGRVQSGIYPQGGEHPGSRLLYLELTQRF